MTVGNRKFENYTYVMAIVNVTPDSFWKASRTTCDGALFSVERALKEGASLIDIGGQSTRPSYSEIPPEGELSRLEKPVYEIKRRFDVPLSVDTYFPEVAEAVLSLGADMINDVKGLSNGGMAEIIARFNAAACIMHNSRTAVEGDVFAAVEAFLKKSAARAVAAGIDRDKICLDGGIGFAKSREQNLALLADYGRLSALGYPLLMGASRKSLFGGDVESRLSKTLEATRLAAKNRVLFVRVHDIKENVRAIKEEYGYDIN